MRSFTGFFGALVLGAALSACGSDGHSASPNPDDGGLDGSATGGSGGDGGASGSGGSADGGAGGGASGSSGSGSGGASGSGGSGEPDAGPDATTPMGDSGAEAGADADTIPPCADGGAGGPECLTQNGEACEDDPDCASGHCVDGICCAEACDSPGTCQQLEGTRCVNGTTCRYGQVDNDTECDDGDACTETSCFEGLCAVDSRKDCSDGNACTADTCDADTGECVNTAVDVATFCDDENPCTTDTCDDDDGCLHADDDGADCSDGNACTDDVCAGGLCTGTPIDCSGSGDDCNEGICNDGACEAQPANNGGACSEIGECDASGSCDDAGHCVGDDNACGNLATSCTTCSGGANCYQGRLCSCVAMSGGNPVQIVNGVCVPDTDECNQDPCDPIATSCNDPTPDGSMSGDVVCTCPSGYTGDGLATGTGCVDIDECDVPPAQNPCGPGAGCDGTSPPGSYTCSCSAGLTSIPTPSGPTCTCDLEGTYAYVATTNVSWDAISVGTIEAIEASPPGGVDTHAWSLRYQTIRPNGSLRVETVPCGGTTPDLCDLVFSVAHAQFQPSQAWGKTKINSGAPPFNVNIRNARPNGNYVEPQISSIAGIVLQNPAGEWPPCRQCVGKAMGEQCTCPGATQPYTVVNPASWFDADEDGKPGITTVDVEPGGATINGMYPDPPTNYTEPTVCPRNDPNPPRFNYGPWPGADTNGNLFFAYQWYAASRIISRFSSTTIELDGNQECRIIGQLSGPGGRPTAEARVAGCESCGVQCNAQSGDVCSAAEVDSYDIVDQTQRVNSIDVVIEKSSTIDLGAILALSDETQRENMLNQACAEVRAQYCPAGADCD